MIEGISSAASLMPLDMAGNLAASSISKMGARGNIEKTAQDFEAMFATQLLQPMFETVKVNSAFGGGNGEAVMRSFLVQEYGKIIAKTGKLGIASQVKAEMLKAQENFGNTSSDAPGASAQAAYINAKGRG